MKRLSRQHRSEVGKFHFRVLKPSDVIVQKSENYFLTYHGHSHLHAVNSQFWVKYRFLCEFPYFFRVLWSLLIEWLSWSNLFKSTAFDKFFMCLLDYCMRSQMFCNILHYETNQSITQSMKRQAKHSNSTSLSKPLPMFYFFPPWKGSMFASMWSL